MLTQGLDFFRTFIDFVRDTSFIQEDGEEESTETCSNNHDMGVPAVAGRRELGGILD